MPTLSTEAPDTLDLDYFFKNHANSYGIAIYEKEPTQVRAIPDKYKPTKCITMELRTHPATHIFPAPATTATVKCMCGLFHTQFIAENNKTYELNTQTNETTTNKQAKKLQQILKKSTANVPPSPTATIHTHICPKCQIPINCKVNNNNHALQNESTFYQDIAYHNNCLAEIYKEMTLANQSKPQPTENPEQGPSS